MKVVAVAAAFTLAGLLASSARAADDPCAGYDVACEGDECLVCWNIPGGVQCEEESRAVLKLILPGCVDTGRSPGFSARPSRSQPAILLPAKSPTLQHRR